MATSFLRGHEIIFIDSQWVYLDTKSPTIGNRRSCNLCGTSDSEEGHDMCLGTLLGVMNACCGHGIDDEAYVQFSTDHLVTGKEAKQIITKLRNT